LPEFNLSARTDRADVLDLAAAVEANVRDGDIVAMEGFTHLIPFAAALILACAEAVRA
jgi:acyl CoA:acetate/3-ketoacid CoA transferase alpha subunit